MKLATSLAEKFINPKTLLLCHFVIFSIGLQKNISFFINSLYQKFSFYPYVAGANDWLAGSFHKPAELIQYVLACIALFTLYFIVFALHKHDSSSSVILKLTTQSKRFAAYLLTILIFNVTLFVAYSDQLIISLGIFWAVGFFWLPATYFGIFNKKIVLPRKYCYFLALGFFMQICAIFLPLITQPMSVENSYLDISGQTKLKDGKIFDTIAYANAHHIYSSIRYDPRIDKGKTLPPRQDSYVELPNTPLLKYFLNESKHKYKFSYNSEQKTLAVKAEMTTAEKENLYAVYQHKPAAMAKIDTLYYVSKHKTSLDKKRVYTPEELEFTSKNLFERFNQSKAGYFFYHHNYFLGPMNAISLGADIKTQNIVYGGLSTVVFSKVLQFLGGINYQNYFQAFFSCYLLYYLLFFVLTFLIFQQAEYTALVLLLTTSSILLIGVEFLKLAPGFNPIRHLFDILTFYLFFLYLTRSQKRWLIFSLLLALFSILWSKEFGLFQLVSIVGSLLIKEAFLERRSALQITAYLIVMVIGLGLFALPSLGNNPSLLYMLLGVSTPHILPIHISILMLFISLVYFIFIKIGDVPGNFKFLSLSLFFYFQALLIYFIWYPEPNHFFNIMPIGSLFAVSLIYTVMNYSTYLKDARKWLAILTYGAFLLVYIPSTIVFYLTAYGYHQNFTNHVMYDWRFEKAQFKSTMDPAVFENAVQLVKKYNSGNALYIISKYDHILPILAGKYSAMPYLELPTNLATSKEVKVAIDALNEEKPRYLFVDTDIDRNLNTDIINVSDPLLNTRFGKWMHDLSRGRVMVMNELKNVFNSVRSEYEIIDKGYIISVYKRKSTSLGNKEAYYQ